MPIQIGRNPAADLCLEDPGVWDRHFQILWEPRGLICQVEKSAMLRVNGEPSEQAVLRGGDVVSIGAVQLQFALAPVRQSNLLARECLIWAALALICLSQVVLVNQLLR